MRATMLAAACLALFLAAPAAAVDGEGCLTCHGLPGFGRSEGKRLVSLAIDGAAHDGAFHGGVECRDCHRDVVSIPHETKPGTVPCGLICHTAGEEVGYSHEQVLKEIVSAVHGRKAQAATACRGCHGDEARGGEAGGAAARCAGCHRDSRAVVQRAGDVHGRLDRAGSYGPSCQDCHGAHGVRAVDDHEASVHPSKVAATCAGGLVSGGGACHRPAETARLAGMTPLPGHWSARAGGSPIMALAWLAVAAVVVRVLRELFLIGRRG